MAILFAVQVRREYKLRIDANITHTNIFDIYIYLKEESRQKDEILRSC
jgi:hypothetical protein